MERHLEGFYINSAMFVSELRRRMPGGRRMQQRKLRPPPPAPSAALSDLRQAITGAVSLPSARASVSPYRAVEAAARGEEFSSAVVAHNIMPDTLHRCVEKYQSSVYGARFIGEDGARFVTSCQDHVIRVYETGKSECEQAWKQTHEIEAHEVRWTITDFDVSPDGRWLAYASMSKYVHLVDLENGHHPQVALDFSPSRVGRLNIWSVMWSHDGREIIAGTGGSHLNCHGNVIVYDVQVKRIVEVIAAHEEDVNSVCFLQQRERNLVLSGSDDTMVKMWDRRDMSQRRRGETHNPCGLFVGHQYGITFVSTRNDGRFLLSNGKDQFIKLWDARKFTPTSDLSTVRLPPRDRNFDYCRHVRPHVAESSGSFRDDAVATYGGEHETLQTLIRARFSPARTTGQKYIYCGSGDGRCVIYDALTGEMVQALAEHKVVVRDVSWHPLGCFLATSSWDGRVLLWSASKERQQRCEGASGAGSPMGYHFERSG